MPNAILMPKAGHGAKGQKALCNYRMAPNVV